MGEVALEKGDWLLASKLRGQGSQALAARDVARDAPGQRPLWGPTPNENESSPSALNPLILWGYLDPFQNYRQNKLEFSNSKMLGCNSPLEC